MADSQTLHQQDVQTSMVVLANAATLTAEIISAIAGNDISSSLNGVQLRRDTLYMLAMTRFKQRLG